MADCKRMQREMWPDVLAKLYELVTLSKFFYVVIPSSSAQLFSLHKPRFLSLVTGVSCSRKMKLLLLGLWSSVLCFTFDLETILIADAGPSVEGGFAVTVTSIQAE